ncbi:D-isomer-specific 2-hydroxyacid dehydrogenase NAD-binding protein [Mycena sanguinolenta]|uniref:D-isomer-specific 2-hydroxyacid dehydrogenase NAD-binding protein n=1 Tax=Mycena sanguinolenta TaxID=230812 RepID=A0A8H7CJ33_9AGAR|nr:D-isomer-specific 2-hydroxyacid dehydrogenase NAD-binding protein [Mycena sanguinolenta]
MSVLRVAICDDYQQVAFKFADWSPITQRVSIDVFSDTIADEDLLVKRLAEYDIICAMRERTKFSASLLDRLPKLRLIATTGLRNLAIDTKHAKSKGITVSGTKGSGATLEHIWALLLATVRHISVEDANVKAKNPQWQTIVPFGLAGKTLGLIGLGRLGTQTAQVAKVFNMKVIAWSPNLTPERAAEAGVEFAATKADLLKESDIVSLHLPTAYLLNTSRGPLIDEDALVAVLKAKSIAGAGLDVFDQEPLPLDHPLRDVNNATLSPHNGYVSDTSYKVRKS